MFEGREFCIFWCLGSPSPGALENSFSCVCCYKVISICASVIENCPSRSASGFALPDVPMASNFLGQAAKFSYKPIYLYRTDVRGPFYPIHLPIRPAGTPRRYIFC